MKKNLRMLHKAVFLDRDGVLNHETGAYTQTVEAFNLLPHIFGAMAMLQHAGFLLIVISNQGGIAKGVYSLETLRSMHQLLIQELARHQITLTDIYFCPHHPVKTACICRKPDSLMIEKAISKYRIDPSRSFFIGDKGRDMECAAKVGVKGILIEENSDWTALAREISAS